MNAPFRFDPAEPAQLPGEDWIAFSRRWDASLHGRAKRAEADALNAEINPRTAHQRGRRRTVSAVIDRTESRFCGT